MEMSDGSIRIDTRIGTENVSKDLKKLSASLKDGVEKASKGATVALAGIAAGIAGIAAASKKFADTTDRVDKMSQAVGLSRRTFQELDYVFAQNGASMDSLQMGMKTLLEKANSNSTAFKQLGVEVRKADGSLKSQDDILKDTIRAFEGVANGQGKAIIAQELFGRNAQDLMPTLNQMSGSMDMLSERANDLGLVLSDKAVDAGVAFGDTMADMQLVMSALINTAIEPLVPLITDAVNGFVEWATEGDKLKTIVQSLGEFIVETWNNGVIPAIIAGVAAIKGISIAFTVFNAVVAANPLVLIITGIIAAIGAVVAGIILLYKNWNKVQTFMRLTIEKIKGAFVILGSKIQESMTVAFNGAKIALYSLTNAITQKLFSAFLGLIDIMAKLDFAGLFTKQLDGARASVNKWSGSLDDALVGAKEESAAAIQAAKDKQDAIETSVNANIAALKKESQAVEEATDALKESAEKELAASQVKTEIIAKTQEQIEEEEALAAIREKTDKEAAIFSDKVLADLMTEKEEREALVSLYESQIDALYQMGATSDGSDEKSEALREYIKNMNRMKKVSGDVAPVAEKGLRGVLLAIRDKSSGIVNQVKVMMGEMSNVIGAGFSFVKGVFSKGFSLISKLAKFDPTAMLASLQEFLSGLENFFTVDLALSPVWLKSAFEMIGSFLSGIIKNLPAIMKTFDNAIDGLVTLIINYGPEFIKAAGKIIVSFANGIVKALPELVKVAVLILSELIDLLLDGLPDFIMAGVEMVVAIINGLGKALPNLIYAIVNALPEIITAIITAFPMIVQAIIDNIPAIIEAVLYAIPLIAMALIQSIPQLIVAVLQVAYSLVEGLWNGIGAAFSGLFKGIGDLFWNWIIKPIRKLFGIHSPSTVFAGLGGDMIQGLINGILSAGAAIWDAVKGIFTGLWDNIKNVFSGAWDLGKSVVSAIGDGIKGVASGAVDLAKGAGSAIVSGVKTAGSAIASGAKAVGGAVASGASAVVSGAGKALKKLKFWDVGSPNISADHIAMVHKGERIVPKTFNQDLMSGNTMMLAPEALSSIMASFTGLGRQTVNISGVVPVMINDREIGRAAFEWLDVAAGGAYGY
jgi:phage-related protein